MAVTAEISANETSVQNGAPVRFVVKISNTGAAALDVENVTITTRPLSAAVAIGQPSFTPASTTQVAATNGTLHVPFGGTFYALPKFVGSPTQQSGVGVAATVTMSDGTIVTSQIVNIQITPTTEPMTATPSGQWDFTSNNNSAQWALGFMRP